MKYILIFAFGFLMPFSCIALMQAPKMSESELIKYINRKEYDFEKTIGHIRFYLQGNPSLDQSLKTNTILRNIARNFAHGDQLLVAAKLSTPGAIEWVKNLLSTQTKEEQQDLWFSLFKNPTQDSLAKMEILLKAGIDINIKNGSGDSALMRSIPFKKPGSAFLNTPEDIANIQKKLFTALIAHKADLNVKNNVQESALTMAISNHDVDLVEELLKAGADANIKSYNGEPALVDALGVIAYNGDARIFKALIKAGADPLLKDDKGKSAYDHAEELNVDLSDLNAPQKKSRCAIQ
jgi:hypothetical protein